jgi:hypothetical protein
MYKKLGLQHTKTDVSDEYALQKKWKTADVSNALYQSQ